MEKKETTSLASSIANMSVSSSAPAVAAVPEVVVTEQKDPAKRMKALRKKLRDIEELAGKKHEELSKEQLEKLSKKESIEAEIRALEMNES